MKELYPVRINYDENDKIFYVHAPDLGEEGEYITDGDTLFQAVEYAHDALNLLLCDYEQEHNGRKPNAPSKLEDFHAKDGEIYTYICVDTENYKKFIKVFKEIQKQEEALKQTA